MMKLSAPVLDYIEAAGEDVYRSMTLFRIKNWSLGLFEDKHKEAYADFLSEDVCDDCLSDKLGETDFYVMSVLVVCLSDWLEPDVFAGLSFKDACERYCKTAEHLEAQIEVFRDKVSTAV